GHPELAVELGHAQVAKVIAIAQPGEHDPGATRLPVERLHAGPERALEDVVGKQHNAAVPADELLSQAERLGDPTRLFLVRIEKPVDAELMAVAEQAQKLAGVRAAGDRHD